MGTGAPEFVTHPPNGYRKKLKPGEKEPGFSLVLWNQVLLRNRQMRGKNGLRGQRAYKRFPCSDCQAHEAETPPKSNKDKKLHGFYWHRQQTRELADGAIALTQQRFQEMLTRARQATAGLGEDGSCYESLVQTMRPEAITRFGEGG
jgi:hypothetical protein